MKTNRPLWTFRLLALSVSLLISAMGCATHTARSYNEDFSQSLPTDPKYFIQNEDDNHFKLTLHQGSTEQGPQRVIDMKNAAPVIADAEAKRRGWQSWQLNYIQERNQGWMHVLIAEVTRKNPAEMSPDRPAGNP